MGFITESDVQKLVLNSELMAEVATALVDDPATMDQLADDIADKMQDELSDNADMRQHIIDAAVASPQFKKVVAAKLAENLG